MGSNDDTLSKALPGGSLAKPLMIALGALLVSRMMNQGNATAQSPASPADTANAPDGGLLGGLGGLLEKLQKAGQGDTADSWVGTGQNKPIDPGQLGAALGQTTISDIAKQAGISEQELLAQLSKVLPGVVDKLTPNGRVPSLQEVAAAFLQR